MSVPDRRTFLKALGSAALASALPGSISRALAIPAHSSSKSILDVEHIVILMQENRSFDHYFGTMRGVRGYGDPRAVKLPSGDPVWQQPDGAGGYLLPFRPKVPDLGMTFLPDPPHGWNDTHAAWNGGRYDQWVPKKGVTTMTYHTRHDLRYYYELADAFTICDNYHCSLLGPTDPNRYHMWTGWVGNDGAGGGPVLANDEAGYDWSTYPERLQAAGISWKVYQDIGVGLTAEGFWGWTGDEPYIGNFGDNSLLYFHQYQNALPGNPLADNAKTGTNIKAQGSNPERLMDILRADVQSGKLPQVSWIVAPEAYCEHPNWEPDYGVWYVSQVLDILTSDADLWSPPTPNQSAADGASTVSTLNEVFAGSNRFRSGPYGLGVRVPMIVVSPWTKGGFVNSQLFDHTSLIRFLETRFAAKPGLVETNITAWRRAVVGDLTSAFDFANPEAWKKIHLPNTDHFKPASLVRYDDEVPVPPDKQKLPKQEPGVRPARALPYALQARGAVTGTNAFSIDFWNTGTATAVFHVRSGNPADAPRSYTVEPGKQLSGAWTGASYDLSVHGPNGFLRAFEGSTGGARLDITASYDDGGNSITLNIANQTAQETTVQIEDAYSRKKNRDIKLGGNQTTSKRFPLEKSFGWYDLTITVDEDPAFQYQFAGHVENGEDSWSDPAFGA
jgi:phospholipase C